MAILEQVFILNVACSEKSAPSCEMGRIFYDNTDAVMYLFQAFQLSACSFFSLLTEWRAIKKKIQIQAKIINNIMVNESMVRPPFCKSMPRYPKTTT